LFSVHVRSLRRVLHTLVYEIIKIPVYIIVYVTHAEVNLLQRLLLMLDCSSFDRYINRFAVKRSVLIVCSCRHVHSSRIGRDVIDLVVCCAVAAPLSVVLRLSALTSQTKLSSALLHLKSRVFPSLHLVFEYL
jgi:hypothetical protein